MRRDDILALKEQRATVHKQMTDKFAAAEGEGREFTAEEAQEYDTLESEFRSLTQRWQKAEELYNSQKEVQRSLETPIDLRINDDDDVPSTLSEYRSRMRQQKPWDTPEFRAAWYHSMSVRDTDELDIEERRVLSKASAGAGLNLVPTAFADEIINIARFMGPINELAETMTTDSGEALQIPSVTAHGTASWLAENAAYSPSDETFGQVTLNAFKAGAKVIVSEELLADASFGLDRYLTQEFGERIGVLEETAFAVGDGSGKPLGIANASSGVTVSQAAVGNTTTFTYAALAAFAFAVPYQYRRNAVWIMADSAVRNLYTMVDSQARPLWNVNVANTGPDTFLGYPIYTSPDLAAPAASAKSGIFGDIRRGYRIRRADGFSMQRQNELHSDNGQVGFRGFTRVDGRVVNADAMRVLQHSAT
jgi:HK97 family phage major capsid protein